MHLIGRLYLLECKGARIGTHAGYAVSPVQRQLVDEAFGGTTMGGRHQRHHRGREQGVDLPLHQHGEHGALAPDGAPPSPARRTATPARRTPRLLEDRLDPFAATTVSISLTHRRFSAPCQ